MLVSLRKPFVLFSLLALLFLRPANAWLPSADRIPESNSSVRAAWLPRNPKLRGVNLGSLFIIEPWMAWDAWSAMGCAGTQSEFDCMMRLGQAAGNAAFQRHWDTWITRNDILEMVSYGINTIRIPVGYWARQDVVWRDSEWFPEGLMPYLERVCGWASDAGMYIIIDLHGAPGAQVARNSFTGQFAPSPGFYVSWNYERTYRVLEWLAARIHTAPALRNVGALQVLNEPVRSWEHPDMCASMLDSFYPNAWRRIRAAEDMLGVGKNDRLHIIFMNEKWGSGDPNRALRSVDPSLWFAAYDDHRYIKWSGTAANRWAYMSASCHDDRGGNWPTVVGEWSLSVEDSAEWNAEFTLDRSDAVSWYKQWWAAQVIAYEKQNGWIFWSWKANWIGGRNDWRWSYQAAVRAGAIPKNPDEAYKLQPCRGFVKGEDLEL